MVGQTYGTPSWRRHTKPALIVLVVLAVGAAIAAAAMVMAGGGGGAPASGPTHPAGATVSDSWFGFHVVDVRTRKQVEGAAAKGTFVLVSLDARNNDFDKPWTVFARDQKLRAGGKTYAADAHATAAVDKGPEVGSQENVNPGATERITLVYDVPAGAVPQAIELHGDPKSRGVTVALPGTLG